MKGKRDMNMLPFYDILMNPDYRMRFEYADPIRIDKHGKIISQIETGKENKDNNNIESLKVALKLNVIKE